MSRKTLSVLIISLMLLSVVPVALAGTGVTDSESQVSHEVTKLAITSKEPETTKDPMEKIEPKLLDILKGNVEVYVPEVNGKKLLPIHIVATSDISSKMKGVEMVGKSEIAGMTVYLALIPVKEESERIVLKIASIPEVEAITRTNPFEPIGDVKPVEEKKNRELVTIPKSRFSKAVGLKGERFPEEINGYRVVKLTDLLPERLKELQDQSPARKGDATLEKRDVEVKNPIQPQDYFAIYHHGALNSWTDLEITGDGINVAVIDSGVDFGNPDLQDAYAVDMNPESPYYGWPIAFSGHSMIWYLLMNMTFPDYMFSWYADTSRYVLSPVIMEGNFSIGYKGNFTTVFTSMDLANVIDDYERAEIINATLNWIGNVSTILLVDDDGGDLLEEFYINALNILGANYTYYEVQYGKTGPNSTVMSNYDLVMWFTGATYRDTLTIEDIGNLAEYLDSGGKLWLISQDYLYDKASGPIYTSGHVIYKQENATAPPEGNSTQHYFNVTASASVLRVVTTSDYSNLDIDIELYYYNETSGEWRFIGGSYGLASMEEITIENSPIGQYRVDVYSYENPYDNATYTITVETANITGYFTYDYLHVGGVFIEDMPVPTVLEDFNGSKYRAGEVYYGLYGSPTDIWADYIVPDENATVLLRGYTAYATDGSTLYLVKLPLSNNLDVPTQSGEVHLGLHPDLALWFYWYGGWVLVTDPNNATVYDTVYVDLTPVWEVIDFNEDVGHTKNNPVVQLDFWDSYNEWFGQDGYADLSGGLVYFIADGRTPIPYSDVVADRWGLNLPVPENGDLVAFMIGTDWIGGGDHGTLCAAAVGARGRTFIGLTFGTAIGAKIIAEGSLYSGGSWFDYIYFAVQGYDGVPGTGDEALIVSNSYGISSIIEKGYTWDDRFLYWITHLYTPYTTFLFAAGNGGPGYGTVTSNGASPGVITVGAAVEYGYRNLFGYDGGPLGYEFANYGDVVEFSNRGPNALGQIDPDVLAVGAYALGSIPVNSVGDGFWAGSLWGGTSLATPMAAGIVALVYEAYYLAHGTLPTAEEVKEILMSTATNVNHDVFSQGAGFLNAYRAVQAALEMDGIVVSPSSWQAGKTDYPAFANVLYPGEGDSQEFVIKNMNQISDKNVSVSAEVFEKIGETTFEVSVGGLYRIDQYIPDDAELMKVTMYIPYEQFDEDQDYSYDTYPYFELFSWTDTNGNGTIEFWYETNRVQHAAKAGTTASTMLGNPWDKFTDGLLLRVRAGGNNNMVKLEFYKRVPWKWVVLNETTLTVPASGSATFKATLTVPEDAPFGVYEGAIYLQYDGYETTIPISVVVASPTPEFEFGGNINATGLYDNSNVYGYMDWWWRYESGDWRLFYFNIGDEYSIDDNTYIVADVSWDGLLPTDIDLHLLGPEEDTWSQNFPEIYGPYALDVIASSKDTYMGSGVFQFETSSGGTREIIAGSAQNGLHALWLHNVLFDGNASFRTFYGKAGLLSIYPNEWNEYITQENGTMQFLVSRTIDFGDITASAKAAITDEYKGVLAPDTGYSHYYALNVTPGSARLHVKLTSIYDDLAGVDLDLYVYHNGQLVGSSLSPTSDEEVVVDDPEPGEYIIEVYSWNNPVPGEATYDLEIYDFGGEKLEVANITKIGTEEYQIDLAYHDIPVNESTLGTEVKGLVFIGSDLAPKLVTVPVTLVVGNISSRADTRIVNVILESEEDVIKVGSTVSMKVIIVNEGPAIASNAEVVLFRDNVPIDRVVLGDFNISEVYEVVFNITITDDIIHEYKVVVSPDNDYNMGNNYNIMAIRGMEVEEFSFSETGNVTINAVSNGIAEVTKVEKKERKIEVTVDGTHGAIVTLMFNLPRDLHYYDVTVHDADLISSRIIRVATSTILEIKVQLHSPAQIIVDYMTASEALYQIGTLWYVVYNKKLDTFEELYNKAVELGIDNETIQEALHHKEIAEQYYEEASKFGPVIRNLTNPRVLPYLRKAYIHMKKAVEILTQAIE